jgi:hypothetical protein
VEYIQGNLHENLSVASVITYYTKHTHGQGMTVSVPFVTKLSSSVKKCLTPSLFSFGCSYLGVGSGVNKKISNRITQLYNITLIHGTLLEG